MSKHRKEPTFGQTANEGESVEASAPDFTPKPSGSRSQASIRPTLEDDYALPSADSVGRSSGSLGLTLFALLIALLALGACGYLYTLLQGAESQSVQANARLAELESKLAVTGDESAQSVTALQVRIKALANEQADANSEIKKLWGVANDRNKKALAAQEKSLKSLTSKLSQLDAAIDKRVTAALNTQLAAVRSELSVVNDLVDAQQSAISSAEKLAKSAQTEASRAQEAITKDTAAIEKRLAETEDAIQAFDAFRLSVSRDLNALKATTP